MLINRIEEIKIRRIILVYMLLCGCESASFMFTKAQSF